MRHGPPPIVRPTGFTLVGLYVGWKALSGFLLAVNVGLEPRPLDAGLDRAALLLAVFAAVAAESLWRCRPWCVRATVAYFCATLVGPLAGLLNRDPVQSGEAVILLLMRLIVVVAVGMYVQQRARGLFAPRAGAGAVRVAVPRP